MKMGRQVLTVYIYCTMEKRKKCNDSTAPLHVIVKYLMAKHCMSLSLPLAYWRKTRIAMCALIGVVVFPVEVDQEFGQILLFAQFHFFPESVTACFHTTGGNVEKLCNFLGVEVQP